MSHILVNVMAAVINTKQRIVLFGACLVSIIEQTKHVPTYIVLWCKDKSWIDALKDMCKDYPNIKFMIASKQCSQYCNFKALFRKFSFPPSTYILFSDDDDIWHPRRVEMYYDCLQRCANTKHPYVSMANYCTNIIHTNFDDDIILSAQQVDKQLELGKLHKKLFTQHNFREVWSLAVRSVHVYNFFNKVPTALLKLSLCDIYFYWYLHSMPNYICADVVFPWLYFYRKQHLDCITARLTQDIVDDELFKRLEQVMEGLFADNTLQYIRNFIRFCDVSIARAIFVEFSMSFYEFAQHEITWAIEKFSIPEKDVIDGMLLIIHERKKMFVKMPKELERCHKLLNELICCRK